MTPYPDEAVERAIALARKIDGEALSHSGGTWAAEARAIVALLPVPVDPDIAIATKLAHDLYPMRAEPFHAGSSLIRDIASGIKRGRELERASQ